MLWVSSLQNWPLIAALVEGQIALSESVLGDSIVLCLITQLEGQEKLCPTASPSHRSLYQCFPFLPEAFS